MGISSCGAGGGIPVLIPMFSLCFGDGVQGKAGARAGHRDGDGFQWKIPGIGAGKSQGLGSGSQRKTPGIWVRIPTDNPMDLGLDLKGKSQGLGPENPRDWALDPAGKSQDQDPIQEPVNSQGMGFLGSIPLVWDPWIPLDPISGQDPVNSLWEGILGWLWGNSCPIPG